MTTSTAPTAEVAEAVKKRWAAQRAIAAVVPATTEPAKKAAAAAK